MNQEEIDWTPEQKSWDEFRATGLFLFINSFLHIFGWALVLNMENDKVKSIYPARVKYRGWGAKEQSQAHKMLADYMVKNAEVLKSETEL